MKKVRLYPLDAPETASADAIVSAIAERDHAEDPGGRDHVGALVERRQAPARRDRRAVADANDGRGPSEQILLCVDGVHGFGIEDASPVDLGVHVFASGCHKWLFGPRGTGLVWAAGDAWERLAPTIPTFDGGGIRGVALRQRAGGRRPARSTRPAGSTRSSTAGRSRRRSPSTRRSSAAARRWPTTTHALATRLKEGLAEIDGVTVKTPMDEELSAGLVAVELARSRPRDAVDRLREEHKVVTSVTPYATEYLRFGPSVANTEDDVDEAIAAVAAIA